MEIWIRSQNKRHLELVNDIMIFNNKFITDETVKFVPNNKNFIIRCNGRNFGEFTTEVQAMKVLNEIVDLIKPRMIIKFNTPIKPLELRRYQRKTNTIVLTENQELEKYLGAFYQIPEDKGEVLSNE